MEEEGQVLGPNSYARVVLGKNLDWESADLSALGKEAEWLRDCVLHWQEKISQHEDIAKKIKIVAESVNNSHKGMVSEVSEYLVEAVARRPENRISLACCERVFEDIKAKTDRKTCEQFFLLQEEDYTGLNLQDKMFRETVCVAGGRGGAGGGWWGGGGGGERGEFFAEVWEEVTQVLARANRGKARHRLGELRASFFAPRNHKILNMP